MNSITYKVVKFTIVAAIVLQSSLLAEVIVKDGNNDDLNLGSSWIGGIVPGSGDIAMWDTNSPGDVSCNLGTNLFWKGLYVDNRVVRDDIAIKNTGGYSLTLGSEGIYDLPNIALSVYCNVILATNQTWFLNSGYYNSGPIDLQGHTLTIRGGSNKGSKYDITGGGTVVLDSGYFQFFRNAPDVDFIVNSGADMRITLYRGGPNMRAANVTLRGGLLGAYADSGTSTTTYQTDVIGGSLTFDPGFATVTLYPKTSSNERLTVGSLVRNGGGIALFRGTGLGISNITDQAINTGNIEFTNAPLAQLIGGGGSAGTTNISILPWAVGGITTTDGGSTFVTYDVNKGIRPLDVSTEFATNVVGGSVTDANVYVPAAANLNLEGATTVNSLLMGSSSSVTGSNKLTVTSGAVFCNGLNTNPEPYIDKELDFGTSAGVIGLRVTGNWVQFNINGGISGSGGLTLHESVSSDDHGIRINAPCSYTGDTYIFGRVCIASANVLPSGVRSGDVNLDGVWEMRTDQTINGLNGSGVFRGRGSTYTITFGDNDADGSFAGSYSDYGTLNFVKIGAGTQRFTGNFSFDGTTEVEEGTLLVDGNYSSGKPVTVRSGAALGGIGTLDASSTSLIVDAGGIVDPGSSGIEGTLAVSNDVSLASGAVLNVDVVDGEIDGSLLVGGTVTSAGTAIVNVTGEKAETPQLVLKALGGITGSFSSNKGTLTLQNANTELWISFPPSGLIILIQ